MGLFNGGERGYRKIVSDKLPSYGAARKCAMPTSMHCHERYANNRVGVSHEHTQTQERQMRWLNPSGQAQRFLAVHSQGHNLFRVGRHLLRAANYRLLRILSFEMWQQCTADTGISATGSHPLQVGASSLAKIGGWKGYCLQSVAMVET